MILIYYALKKIVIGATCPRQSGLHPTHSPTSLSYCCLHSSFLCWEMLWRPVCNFQPRMMKSTRSHFYQNNVLWPQKSTERHIRDFAERTWRHLHECFKLPTHHIQWAKRLKRSPLEYLMIQNQCLHICPSNIRQFVMDCKLESGSRISIYSGIWAPPSG